MWEQNVAGRVLRRWDERWLDWATSSDKISTHFGTCTKPADQAPRNAFRLAKPRPCWGFKRRVRFDAQTQQRPLLYLSALSARCPSEPGCRPRGPGTLHVVSPGGSSLEMCGAAEPSAVISGGGWNNGLIFTFFCRLASLTPKFLLAGSQSPTIQPKWRLLFERPFAGIRFLTNPSVALLSTSVGPAKARPVPVTPSLGASGSSSPSSPINCRLPLQALRTKPAPPRRLWVDTMPTAGACDIRVFRSDRISLESVTENERSPFLSQGEVFRISSDLENGCAPGAPGRNGGGSTVSSAAKLATVSCILLEDLEHHNSTPLDHVTVSLGSGSWRAWPSSLLSWLAGRRSRAWHKAHVAESSPSRASSIALKPTALRRILRLLAISLMLLGIVEIIALACGLFTAFFPDELSDSQDGWKPSGRLSDDLSKWPTDFSADIQPVACHSHNDYWRKEPLFSAIEAGCTGVEADVWLFDDDLYVGHTPAALTTARTLRSLYIDPLIEILDKQNPITTFHPSLDTPRHGVFDTKPSETLVLLIDFKTEGDHVWSHVYEQLEPLRKKRYLTYFNGSDVVEGPITVVATGNAPFSLVVANPHYRDIFFDAPLDVMASLPDTTLPSGNHAVTKGKSRAHANRGSLESSSDFEGQPYEGAAPSNPAVYSRANSYYASVSFQSSIGWPWRGHLSRVQRELIHKQIAGAHARGLKVRYWSVPSWPRGMRNYLWQVLVREGVDYLNVDDLHAATTSDWAWGKKGWWSGFWLPWT